MIRMSQENDKIRKVNKLSNEWLGQLGHCEFTSRQQGP